MTGLIDKLMIIAALGITFPIWSGGHFCPAKDSSGAAGAAAMLQTVTILKEKKPSSSLFQLLGLSGLILVAVVVRLLKNYIISHQLLLLLVRIFVYALLLLLLVRIFVYALLSFAVAYYISSIFYWKKNRDLLEAEVFNSVMSEEGDSQNQD